MKISHSAKPRNRSSRNSRSPTAGKVIAGAAVLGASVASAAGAGAAMAPGADGPGRRSAIDVIRHHVKGCQAARLDSENVGLRIFCASDEGLVSWAVPNLSLADNWGRSHDA